ncbi:pyrimidine dimer DNA glycosylase/endonuclease V [Georgenia ruanii]|uniref:Pyrimidine dimer DNA glycosylase n=1 Tax=Georgenia ruanii TaxID=348442 RepID=A0A7J9UTI5_9MICO|nr:pyrimidine dimer DNA glycosylase/endonuclease V [Georgenia ruanii]MPV87935.1 pyrimidine dimer DNA glycosylase [Georgenia ruanii]
MRIWSLHPRYLDRQGLTACWRESLLAQAVLAGRTRGYRRHSQLERFRAQSDPLAAVGAYLVVVAEEAAGRGYRFDTGRIDRPAAIAPADGADGADRLVGVGPPPVPRVPVTEGQVGHEWGHLAAKLAVRSPERAAAQRAATPAVHPLFVVVPGPVEAWERV